MVKSDGSIWFTDPSYGIDTDYEGDKAESEIGACHVYRVDPDSGEVEAVITDMVQAQRPRLLARREPSSMSSIPAARMARKIRRICGCSTSARAARRCRAASVFADCTAGLFDGFRLDEDGPHLDQRRPTASIATIPDGTLIGKVKVPEVTANCVFGGNKRNALYIAGTTSLYMVRLMVNGAKTY